MDGVTDVYHALSIVEAPSAPSTSGSSSTGVDEFKLLVAADAEKEDEFEFMRIRSCHTQPSLTGSGSLSSILGQSARSRTRVCLFVSISNVNIDGYRASDIYDCI